MHTILSLKHYNSGTIQRQTITEMIFEKYCIWGQALSQKITLTFPFKKMQVHRSTNSSRDHTVSHLHPQSIQPSFKNTTHAFSLCAMKHRSTSLKKSPCGESWNRSTNPQFLDSLVHICHWLDQRINSKLCQFSTSVC